jgi:hypothetical protein
MNDTTTKLEELDLASFLAKFDDSVREALLIKLQNDGVDALVGFENVNLSSSALGARTALTVGPGCTYKSVAEVEGQHLNDLPSQRMYAQYFVRRPKSYVPEVIADATDTWSGNGLRFKTYVEALAWARDLSQRWTAVRQYRANGSQDEPKD